MRASTSRSSLAATAGVRQRGHHCDKKSVGAEFEQLPGSMLSSANVTPNSSGQSSPVLTRKGSSFEGRSGSRQRIKRKRANGDAGGGSSSASQDGSVFSLIRKSLLLHSHLLEERVQRSGRAALQTED